MTSLNSNVTKIVNAYVQVINKQTKRKKKDKTFYFSF